MSDHDYLNPSREPEEGEGGGETLRHRSYDPLFSVPEERSGDADGSAFDEIFGERETLARGDITLQDDELFWNVPASAVLADETPLSEVAGQYPNRYTPTYQERLSEIQKRLRAETITIPKEESRIAVTIRELVETLLLAALIFLAVRASFQNFRVEGQSMNPSLDNGEYLIVNKLAYASLDLSLIDWLPFIDGDETQSLWGDPGRGDVVVFHAPTNPNRDFIKRIIGQPGDTVEIDKNNGEVRINGDLLNEPYIRGRTTCQSQCTFVIPERGTPDSRAECASDACYFVMGDNRQNSSDSRQGWLVPQENVIGKALITYWHEGSPEVELAPNHSVDIVDEAAAAE